MRDTGNEVAFSGLSREIVILWVKVKKMLLQVLDLCLSPNCRYLSRMFRRNVQNPVQKRHVGAPAVVHQYGDRKMVQTSGSYFDYLCGFLSVLNKQAFT